MNQPSEPKVPSENRLDAALGDYMRRLDSGDPCQREQFIAEYPDLEKELRSYFETADQLEQLAGGITSSSDTAAVVSAEDDIALDDVQPPSTIRPEIEARSRDHRWNCCRVRIDRLPQWVAGR